MDDNLGEWVESMGVASGWNLWVWLPRIGVVSGCFCKEVYRYLHNNYKIFPTPLVLAFFASSIPTSLFIFKMFFRSLYLIQNKFIKLT